jgi:hypothetical protein
MIAPRTFKPGTEYAIFAVPADSGRQVRCVSRLRDRRLTSLPRNVLRFPSRAAAELHKTLLDRLPRITYIVDTIAPFEPPSITMEIAGREVQAYLFANQ